MSEPVLDEDGNEDLSKAFIFGNYYVTESHNCFFTKNVEGSSKPYSAIIDDGMAVFFETEDDIREFITTNKYIPVIGEELKRLTQFTISTLKQNEIQEQ